MLKNVKHISEGNFYGLRVTNKAKNVSLDKKLRTLEACKDAQNHCYRKEEKDLMNTLTRLQKSKEHYHHSDKLVQRHVDGEHHDDHKHHTRRHSNSSSASIVVPLSPVLSSTMINISTQRHENPVPVSMDSGSAIHRTTGFIDCVICRLPRHSHVKGTDVCRCEKGPDKGTHHMHPPALHEDKQSSEYLDSKERKELHEHDVKKGRARWSRRGSIEKEHDQMFLEKLQREMNDVIETPLQLNKENGYEKPTHSRHNLDRGQNLDRGHINPRHRINSVLEDERHRQDSIKEEGRYVIPRFQRRMSNELPDKRRDSSGAESYLSLGELKTSSSSLGETQLFRKTIPITHSAQYSPSPPPEKRRHDTFRRISSYDVSHLPKISSSYHEDSTEVFHGLIHPDNIINHHYYLPYEADKSRKGHHNGNHNGHHYGNHNGHHYGNHNGHHYGNHNGHHYGNHNGHRHDDHRHDDRHHGDHHHYDKRHVHGYYIHKYDHSGTRQIAHIPLGANTHIAEMLYKQHEPESNHYSLLSNLRQLLSVYKRLDETLPRYPWPTPPSTEMSTEEFQKLKDCRYLRLPKGMDEPTVETPVFH